MIHLLQCYLCLCVKGKEVIHLKREVSRYSAVATDIRYMLKYLTNFMRFTLTSCIQIRHRDDCASPSPTMPFVSSIYFLSIKGSKLNTLYMFTSITSRFLLLQMMILKYQSSGVVGRQGSEKNDTPLTMLLMLLCKGERSYLVSNYSTDCSTVAIDTR